MELRPEIRLAVTDLRPLRRLAIVQTFRFVNAGVTEAGNHCVRVGGWFKLSMVGGVDSP